jgi:hypothetical protein
MMLTMATNKLGSSATNTRGPASGTTAGGALSPQADNHGIADFIARVKSLAPVGGNTRGRLVFAMDATMSRQPTWDLALGLQAQMFDCVKAVGGLDVQLVYFRGAGECRASKWVSDPAALAHLMTQVDCRGGFTQLGRVLNHARSETETRRISAMVYVGDCMEEPIDDVCSKRATTPPPNAPSRRSPA